MFKIKKPEKQEQGLCLAARCANKAIDGAPIMLCADHGKVWQDAGCPSITEMSTRAPRAPKEPKALPPGMPSAEDVTAQLEPWRVQGEAQLQMIANVEMTSQAAVDWMSGALIEVKKQLAALEAERSKITKPLNEVKRNVDRLFQAPRETLEACEDACNKKLAAFADGLKAAKAEAVKQIGEGVRSAEVLSVVHGGAPVIPNTLVTVSGFDWEVTDLSLVPREFLKIDDSIVNFYVKNKKKDAINAIPGIRVFEVTSMRAAPGALQS